MSEIFDIKIDTIEKLAEIVSAKELSEITITDGDKTVTVKGKKCPPPMPMPMGMPAPVQAAAPAAVEEKAAEAPAEISGNVVKSPLVGTFYQAPSPDKPPFVKVGDRVKKGDVIMIIESMKLMNEVQSDFDGVVDRVLVADGEPVEYDQPIMIIK